MNNDGGPAFAVNNGRPGMSLRDYFAGQYVAGWAARSVSALMWHEVAENAYRVADAMLKEREAAK
jgi:hypothetical protein